MSVQILRGDCRQVLKGLADDSVPATTMAYCAGVIDSDGTIGIKRNTYSMRVRGDAAVPIYNARVRVRQVEPHAVQLLQATFGGAVRINKGQGNSRDLFQWEARDQIAERTLVALLPFLRIKQQQAENALALRELIANSKASRGGGRARDPALTERMEACFLAAKALNIVGKR